jgi:chitodextrinase
MKKAFLCFLAIILTLYSVPPKISQASASVYSNGSFIQPYVSYNWTVNDWKQELKYLKQVGNKLLILQWTADTRSKSTIYPTSIPGLTKESNYSGDPVENLLTAADALGMQVWLGTNVNDDWYTHHALNQPWLDELFNYSQLMVKELWDNYHGHPSLTGFYFPNEMENCSYQDDTSINNLTVKYASLADLVHSYTNTTLSLAPAIWKESNCGQTFEENSTAWEKTWNGILGGANIDYLIPQDGLGGGYHTIAEVVTWFQLTKKVVDMYPATHLWVDIETFHTISSNPWIAEPMVTMDIVDHMIQLSPYVEKIVTFSYDHYQSPKLRSNPIFHSAFKHYYDTGAVDTSGPAVPTGLVSPKQGTDKMNLLWNVVTDTGRNNNQTQQTDQQKANEEHGNHGEQDNAPPAFYFIIYRDGVQVGRSYTASFQDTGLQPSTTYSYQVVSYSASGYPSTLSEAIHVKTLATSVNLAVDKSYTSSIPASPSYPDTDGKEMTNGKLGANQFWDAEWQARSTEGTPLVLTYTVDLGSLQRIDGLSINFLQDMQSAIKLPQSVEFQVSVDNAHFTSLGYSPFRNLNFGPIPLDNTSVPFGLLPPDSVKAQYIKIIVTSSTYSWIFSDELKVEQY